MNEGLIQFLVVAFFIIISMMDGAARKRRKQAQSQGRLPELNALSDAADDLDEATESSEGMVPEDLWQEIAALAPEEEPEPGLGSLPGPASSDSSSTDDLSSTGDLESKMEAWTSPQQDVPQMRTSGTEGGGRAGGSIRSFDRPDAPSLTTTPPADLQGGYLHPDQAATHEEHAHEKHAEVAVTAPTLPAERPHEFVPHPPEERRNPPKEPRSAQKKPQSLLSGLRRGAKSSLREAIVLAQVLSPPLTLRDSGWKPLF